MYPVLLFPNAREYESWLSRRENPAVTEDLKLKTVLRAVKDQAAVFPERFFLTLNNSLETAKHRLETAAALRSDRELAAALDGAVVAVGVLKQKHARFKAQRQSLCARAAFVSFLSEYLKTLGLLCEVFGRSPAPGFCAAARRVREIRAALPPGTEESAALREEIAKIPLCLEINLNKKTLTIWEAEGESAIADEFAALVLAGAGVTAEGAFSAVSQNPPSPLEECVLQYLEKEHGGLIAALRGVSSDGDVPGLEEVFSFCEQILFFTGFEKLCSALEKEGYAFCAPEYAPSGGMECDGVFDLSLASARLGSGNTALPNDVKIEENGGFILSGANQGGKTTYLRSIGITAALAANGLFVPCTRCVTPVFNALHTHFISGGEDLGGRLRGEGERMERMFSALTENDLVFLNESFSGTRRFEGLALLKAAVERLLSARALFCCVTHLYELYETLGPRPGLSNLVALVGRGGERTFKIAPAESGSLAFARDIAEKCGVTYEGIKRMWEGSENGGL